MTRVVFDLDNRKIAQLDELKELLNSSSRVEVVRTAIPLLLKVVREVQNGHKILLVKEGDATVLELLL